MPREREHPVPTERRVLITALDKRQTRLTVEDLLAARGFDVTQPYHEEPQTECDGTLYVQAMPQEETA